MIFRYIILIINTIEIQKEIIISNKDQCQMYIWDYYFSMRVLVWVSYGRSDATYECTSRDWAIDQL